MSGVAITTAGTDLERCGAAARGRLVRLPGLRGVAPSLVTLVRLATTTDQPAGMGRLFAPCGERADIRTLVERSPYRRMTALVRLLALATETGRESGLALDLPTGLLDREFGRGRVVHFEDVDFPAVLTHEPTRRFLRDTGLPEDAFPLRLDTDADVPLPTLEEYAEEAFIPRLPERAARLIRLGSLAEEGHSLVLDGPTGTLLRWTEPTATLHPLGTDLSTLTFTLWLLHISLRAARPTDTGTETDD